MAAAEEDETRRPGQPSGGKAARRAEGSRDSGRTNRTERKGRGVSAPQAMRCAADQLRELLGRAPESVSAIRPMDEGWQADVEVLELERVPTTTSVMASYRVRLDAEGELVEYERTRRYTRGQVDRGG
ncbi:gas vesicle protein [Streptomyces gelaticus]|uniref:Gas vesicle protein n=1 Tax=Streptomyces gelaticus TaxID=285446 RepID=A0ABQ2VZC8_9ACTN|nr:gas vesicle protein [Streptomyces gelaticus]GGV86351.1 gas vesicle protein [Streptomyces gelaticus]